MKIGILRRMKNFNILIKFFSIFNNFFWKDKIFLSFIFTKFYNQFSFRFFYSKIRINLFKHINTNFIRNLPRPITFFTQFRISMKIYFPTFKSFYKQINQFFFILCNTKSFIINRAYSSTFYYIFFDSNISFPINNTCNISKNFFFSHTIII